MKIVVFILALTIPASAELGLPDASNLDAPGQVRVVPESTAAKPSQPPRPVAVTHSLAATEGFLRFATATVCMGCWSALSRAGRTGVAICGGPRTVEVFLAERDADCAGGQRADRTAGRDGHGGADQW